MEPRELAALVAREADVGVAAGLSGSTAAGVLVPETVTARVASVPTTGHFSRSLDDVVWQAEVTFRVGDPRDVVAPVSATGTRLIRDLGVAALNGVGPRWAGVLAGEGFPTVGDLADGTPSRISELSGTHGLAALVFAGRARRAAQAWPMLPPAAREWGSVVALARSDPATLPGETTAAHVAWGLCLDLLGSIDAGVLATIRVADLGS